jgi:hypothetical protein
VAFGTFTARAFSFKSAVFVAWQEDGRRTLCKLSGREEREAAEAVARGDCEAVRRICRGAMRVQLALGGPGANLWERTSAIEWQPESAGASERQPESVSAIEWQPESVRAIEWQPESVEAVGTAIAVEWQPEVMDADECQVEPSDWNAEPARSEGISESESNAQERRQEEDMFKTDLKWPEDFEMAWPEDPEFEETPAAAEIKEAVQCLFEGMTESVRKANDDWVKRLPKRAKWVDASDFVEWHLSVADRAGRLAEDFRKIEETTDSWRRSCGVLSGWKRNRTWVRAAAESWKRHSTPGEMRKRWIRGQRARDEAARARGQGFAVDEGRLRRIVAGGPRNERTEDRVNAGMSWAIGLPSRTERAQGFRGVEEGRRLGSERAEARTADLEAGRTSRVTVGLSSGDAE